MISFIDDAGLRQRTSDSARAYAMSQSWDEIMGALRVRYQRVIGEAEPSPASVAGGSPGA